jgi:hypothetical protein
MNKPKIERGIPIPARYSRQSNELVEAMKKMKVGDSFAWHTQTTVVFRAAVYAGIRITTRKTNQGQRIWRTA